MQNIFIISGPSGSGHDSVITLLEKSLPIERVITTTTRPMRPGESSGSPYYFIDKSLFEKGIAEKKFIEYAQEYNDEYYGVTKEELERVSHSGKIGIWKIEYQGVITAKKLFPHIIAILIIAPLEILMQRIKKRDNPTEEYLEERKKYTLELLKHTAIYDYQVENEQGKLAEATKKVEDIIRKHSSLV